MTYIVNLENGVYLAPLKGDPGRTLVRENARMFQTYLGARRAITKAQRFRSFTNWSIEEVEESHHG